MLGQANMMSQFQMMHTNMQFGQMGMPGMGMPGTSVGFNFGMDSYGGRSFGMNVGMGSGIPFGGMGMGYGMGMSTGMGFGGFPQMGGMGMGMGMGMMGGMNPMMLMMMLMMMMQMQQGQGGQQGMPGMGFPGMPGQNPNNVKLTEGNPTEWYFKHGQHTVKDWTDPQTGKKLGTIDEGGDTRIYHNTETKTGYIYKKVDQHVSNGHQPGCPCHTCGTVSGWQLTEIRSKWEGKAASPIMLDLDGSGTPDVKNGEWKPHAGQGDIGAEKIRFDLDGDGKKELTEWTGGKDGLLLKLTPDQIKQYQQNGNLEVSGKELYGDQGGKYADGYAKMRELSDANQDGKLSGAELQNHYTWQDTNKDGIVGKGELTSVQDKGITSVNATHGGDYQSTFTQNGQERKTWDWWPTTWN